MSLNSFVYLMSKSCVSRCPGRFGHHAFSMVEVLVSVGVIAIICGLGAGVYQGAMAKTRLAREVAAGKNLISAYHLYAADQDGRFMPGMDFTAKSVFFEPENRTISMTHVANRYPFRLAPYFGSKLEGTILVNDNGKQIEKTSPRGSGMYDYQVSAFPAFGMNYYFVGGCIGREGDLVFPDECADRLTKINSPLLVFATGGTGTGAGKYDGYNILTPPRLYGENWSAIKWKEDVDPGNFGNVDARHGGKAVCAYTDGSIRLQTIEELRDMRLWNRNAAAQDNPNYQISQ